MHGEDVPPSQTALRPWTTRMGSLLIISMALRGLGWSSMMVCSKRGPECAWGRGRWLVDHVLAKLGDWGAAAVGDGAS